MSGGPSGAWSRGQDWVSLAAGAYLALAPLWVEAGAGATWSMVLVGLVIVVLALVALAAPGAYTDEWMTALAGVTAFVSPWLFGYASSGPAAWTAWTVGVVVTAAGLAAVPASREAHLRRHAHAP